MDEKIFFFSSEKVKFSRLALRYFFLSRTCAKCAYKESDVNSRQMSSVGKGIVWVLAASSVTQKRAHGM